MSLKVNLGESKKSYLERVVPELVQDTDGGTTPSEAIVIASLSYDEQIMSEELTANTEISIEFKAKFDGSMFTEVASEEDEVYPDMTIGEVFSKMGLDPSRLYKFEFCAKEC